MAVILFGVFIALLLLGVPVAFAICSAAATTMFAGFGDAKMMIVVQRMFASCDSFSLIAVPFFIFAGDLLAGGRISKVLVEFCESLLGMIKGGLSVVSDLSFDDTPTEHEDVLRAMSVASPKVANAITVCLAAL